MTNQGDLFEQGRARDRALDRVASGSPDLVETAHLLACQIAGAYGVVTSTEVWEQLRARAKNDAALAARLDEADPRWMGAVFRRGWKRVRWEATGSHKRPVAVWQRDE